MLTPSALNRTDTIRNVIDIYDGWLGTAVAGDLS